MKRRFKILTIPQEYDLRTQAQIMCALAVVHNFLKIHDPDDQLFKDKTLGLDTDTDTDDTVANQRDGTQGEWDRVGVRRETIALRMWEDYQSRKGRK